MNVLILDEDQEEPLQQLNETAPEGKRLEPAELADGRKFLNADLLNDSGQGETWEHYGEFLDGLQLEQIDPAEEIASEQVS